MANPSPYEGRVSRPGFPIVDGAIAGFRARIYGSNLAAVGGLVLLLVLMALLAVQVLPLFLVLEGLALLLLLVLLAIAIAVLLLLGLEVLAGLLLLQ